MRKYNSDSIKDFLLKKYGYIYLYGEINGIQSVITAKDDYGYLYLCNISKMISRGNNSRRFHTSNPYTIQNINLYLKLNTDNEFECISECYINNKSNLEFRHLKCGRIIKNKWINIYRGRYKNNIMPNKTGLFCEHCTTKHIESAHALVLKQVWLHEHKDTIVEEKSCYNPNTNHVLPTDIVNHRLKVAIEIQSWFHDFEYQKYKDDIKKRFWIDKGYQFYSVDHRNYSILEVVQLFFPNIKKIPSYIDYEYSNKFDDITAQRLINKYLSVNKVSQIMNCNPHLIYNAIQNKRIEYPHNYINNKYVSVVQLDLNQNFIKCFDNISMAQKEIGINGIARALQLGRNYCGGYYWIKKEDYETNNYTITKTRLKQKHA